MASEDYSDLIAAAQGGDDYSDLIAAADAVEEGGPESFLDPKTFKPSKGRRAFKNQTGPIEGVRAGIAAQKAEAPTDVGELAAGPVLSFADRATLGGLGGLLRVARGINESTGTTEPTLASRSLESMEGYRRRNPTASMWSDAPSVLIKASPLGAMATGVGSLAGRAFSRPVTQALAASAVTGGVQGGLQAASEEAPPEEILESIGGGAGTGLAIAGPLTAAAGGAGRLAQAVTNSRGGKARQFLEGQGVDVSPTSPGRGPVMDRMVTKGTTDADIGHQAEVSARRGVEQLNQSDQAVRGVLGRRIGAIDDSIEGQGLRDIGGVVAKMEDASKSFGVDASVRARLRDELALIHENMGKGFNPETDNYIVSEADLNRLRRDLDGMARTGLSTEAKFHPLREAANELRAMVDEGPYRDVNKDYSRELFGQQKSRRLLGLSDRLGKPEESEAGINKVKHLITRRGQNTVTAGGQQDRLAQFERRRPDVAEEFIKPEILRKRADIAFHLLPQKHGGLIDRVGSAGGGLALAEALMQVAGHGHVSPLKVLGTLGGGLALQNLPAIQARLLYPMAQEAQLAAPMLLGEVPLVSAARAARGEERP